MTRSRAFLAPNVLQRNFEVALPNTAWVIDVTHVWTHEGWLYLAVILDLSHAGLSAGPRARKTIALSPSEPRSGDLREVTRTGTRFHSDRGSEHASAHYGTALTNAVAESFFATIKGEAIDHVDYLTRGSAIAAVGDYIDGFYSPCRRHSAIGHVSPIEFELKFLSAEIEEKAA